jgi:hypothetical protein
MNESFQPPLEMQHQELFDSARHKLEEIEGKYGPQSIVLADELETYARLLRTHKGSMIEAFSAESKAKTIRSNFNKNPIYSEVAKNLKKRGKSPFAWFGR